MNSFSRVATALLLVSSLMAGSIASLAQSTQSATTTKAPAQVKEQTTTPKEQTASSKDATKKETPKTTTQTAVAKKKPLSVNEDPMLIGKRNINKGIISKMSGSTEKEVRIGRELAAEVDRQAKFIDDPVIT